MPQLLCTVRNCHLPLAREERRVVCVRGHTFDIARSGYINLLQPQERRSRKPGDSVEAVAARRRFLNRGHAEPLLRAIRAMLPDAQEILDAGCGEGYYLFGVRRLAAALKAGSLLPAAATSRGKESGAKAPHSKGYCGIDISTAAIDLAARRYPQCEWVVANADRFIPYASDSFDLVLSITGRMNSSEFRRVLRDGGALLVAVAAPDDLLELRGSRGRDRVARTLETFGDGYEMIARERATTIAELDAEDARDILRATYRPREGPPQRVTLSFDLMLFRVSP
ncbi:MAG TPA: methyltransferase domain-containing protein [Thermoanaerobaculia bacterium]|nr:methyltransferase domain-containing protein [Thermoanaerobaculia bacterium]